MCLFSQLRASVPIGIIHLRFISYINFVSDTSQRSFHGVEVIVLKWSIPLAGCRHGFEMLKGAPHGAQATSRRAQACRVQCDNLNYMSLEEMYAIYAT